MTDWTSGQEHAILKLRLRRYHESPDYFGATPARTKEIDRLWSLYDAAWSMSLDLNQPASLREHYRSQAFFYGDELSYRLCWPSAY